MKFGFQLMSCAMVASWLLIHAPSTAAVQTSKEGEVRLIGNYVDLRQTTEHVYGYILRLWRDGNSVVGFWSRADGQPGDFPTVSVTDVRWDESTGSFRFTARWCNEIETFEGVLKGRELVGTITSKSASARRSESTKVALTSEESDGAPRPRAAWKAQWDEKMRRSGPKC